MDFFQAQDNARRNSWLLVFLFLAAVVLIIAVLYVVAVLVLGRFEEDRALTTMSLWQPEVAIWVAAGTVALISIGSLTKSMALRAGGGAVAQSLGGTRIDPGTTNHAERRLLNVVEEMAIASGVRVPEVYVLPEEGINAFAAGYSPDDAAVAVTRGALETLSRDELQGVIAHEFSHILNGDMRLNIKLIGLLFGIMLLAVVGRGIFHSMRFARLSGGRRGRGGGGGAIIAIFAFGLAMIIVGSIGVLFGRMIQAAVSRQREFLADASAVQFTRNPSGIAGALKKIGGLLAGSRVQHAHATETSHLFFANALQGSAFNIFSTHPPLKHRIRAIEPSFDGQFPTVTRRAEATDETRTARKKPSTPPPLAPEAFLAAVSGAEMLQPGRGAALIDSLPPALRAAAHDPSAVRAVIVALLATIRDSAIDVRQATTLGNRLTGPEAQACAEAVPLIAGMNVDQKFALLDLALPTIGSLSAPQVQTLLTAIDEMILADYQVTPFEFALKQIVRRYLASAGRLGPTSSRPPGRFRQPSPEDVASVLAMVAHAGTSDPVEAERAFAAGAREFRLPSDRLGPASKRSLPQLTMSLQRLDQIRPEAKRRLVSALAATAASDGTLQPQEQSLMRAFAAALNCPAPVLQE